MSVPSIKSFKASVFMEGLAKEFYGNAYSDKDAFIGLDRVERSAALYEFGYTGYKKAQSSLKSLLVMTKQNTMSNTNKETTSLKLYKDIEKSNGDITKVKEYKDVISLLDYVLLCNGSRNIHTPQQTAASELASTLKGLLEIRAKEAARYKSLISKEATIQNTNRLATNYYNLSTLFMITLVDSFYTDAIKAIIDYSPKIPIVKSIYFEIDSRDYETEYELIGMFGNNNLDMLSKSDLIESFEMASDRMLEEGVFDVIFSIVSQSKILEATVLLPMYMVRMLVYSFFYMKETLNNISVSIDRAIKLKSASNVTEKEFSDFKSSSGKNMINVNQALNKAQSSIRFELEDDRKLLLTPSSKPTTTLI